MYVCVLNGEGSKMCVYVLNGEGSKMFASTCMCVCSEWGREQDVC